LDAGFGPVALGIFGDPGARIPHHEQNVSVTSFTVRRLVNR
jgi:hypothetical protein